MGLLKRRWGHDEASQRARISRLGDAQRLSTCRLEQPAINLTDRLLEQRPLRGTRAAQNDAIIFLAKRSRFADVESTADLRTAYKLAAVQNYPCVGGVEAISNLVNSACFLAPVF